MENSHEPMFPTTPFDIEGKNYKSNKVLVAEREARAAQVKIVILKNDFDEYQVPEHDGEFYFTPDRDDAIATAITIWGDSISISYRRVH